MASPSDACSPESAAERPRQRRQRSHSDRELLQENVSVGTSRRSHGTSLASVGSSLRNNKDRREKKCRASWFFVCVLALVATLSLYWLRRLRDAHVLLRKLADVDHDLGWRHGDDGDAELLDKLDDFSRALRQTWVTGLRHATRDELDDFRDAFRAVVEADAGDALDAYDDAYGDLVGALRAWTDGDVAVSVGLVVGGLAVAVAALVGLGVVARARLEGELQASVASATIAVRSRDQVLKRSDVPVIFVDEHKIIVDINRAALKSFKGYRRRDVLGHDVSLLFPDGLDDHDDGGDHHHHHHHQHQTPESPPATSRSLAPSFATSTSSARGVLTPSSSTSARAVGVDKTGNRRSFMARVAKTANLDGSVKCAIVAVDCTELENMSKQIETHKRVVAHALHDARDKTLPAVELLDYVLELGRSHDETADDVKRKVESLGDGVAAAIALLKDSHDVAATQLDLYGVLSGTYSTLAAHNTQIVDIEALMAERVEHAAAVATRDVVFKFEMPDELRKLEVTVLVDTFVFQHVVDPLLSNARRFTRQGKVTLALLNGSDEFSNESDDQLWFAVSDSGAGIAADVVASGLFGVGAGNDDDGDDDDDVPRGLKSCRLFAEAVGGAVWLERTQIMETHDGATAVPGGSEFRFRLPGRIVRMEQRVVMNERSSATTTTTAVVRCPLFRQRPVVVYIVEDSHVIRKSIGTKLKGICKVWGYPTWIIHEHETVESLAPHLEAIKDDEHVVVTVDEIFDAKGGKLRGTDLIRMLTRLDFQGVIVSASGDVQNALSHTKSGAHVVWGKPFPSAKKMHNDLATAFEERRRDLLARRKKPSSSASMPLLDLPASGSSPAATTRALGGPDSHGAPANPVTRSEDGSPYTTFDSVDTPAS
ncbi:hypothetical protein CTAYLR_010001 [Chrysophaeum taylorii]|uniref:histidine kinase n=1 Tax=Chrysophaeum taylorii TaxID=2483200 RepID=A0AAD7UBA0_9STRA|nr:hypothetical protein CTAYLR_010001 [Chrysophaeum taylorii]